MLTLGAFKQNMRTQGHAEDNCTWRELALVVSALQEDVPVIDMKVNTPERQIPLDQYLATIRQITEIDTYFTGAIPFNIWEVLPLGLTKYPEDLGVQKQQGQDLLERFEAYTWCKTSWKNPYFHALGMSLAVSDASHGTWNLGLRGNPVLSTAVNAVLRMQKFSTMPSASLVLPVYEKLYALEVAIEEIPSESLRDYFNPFGGWQRLDKREKLCAELQPAMEAIACELVPALTALGREFRKEYISIQYPHLR